MTDPLEFGFDVVDDGSDRVDHQVGTFDEPQIPLWKHYACGRVACHLHLGVYFRQVPYFQEFYADFQALRFPEVFETHHLTGPGVDEFRDDNKRPRAERHWIECSVFVSVGEVAKESEGETRAIPSVVGLRVADDCPLTLRDFAEMVPFVDQRLSPIHNRKLDVVAQSFRLLDPEMKVAQPPEQVFKGASQVVDDIPEDDPHPKQQSFRDFRDAKT